MRTLQGSNPWTGTPTKNLVSPGGALEEGQRRSLARSFAERPPLLRPLRGYHSFLTPIPTGFLKRSFEVAQRPAPYESLHRYLEEVASRQPFN